LRYVPLPAFWEASIQYCAGRVFQCRNHRGEPNALQKYASDETLMSGYRREIALKGHDVIAKGKVASATAALGRQAKPFPSSERAG
jgi:hypothetical protein